MGSKTSIEWTKSEDGTAGSSWNPIRARNTKTGKVGWHCDHVSEGCRNCYAEGINRRLGTGLDYKPGVLANGSIEIFLDEKMLLAPLKWKRSRKIFVGSMTDLFARFVPDEMIVRVLDIVRRTSFDGGFGRQHIYQILTKRANRMAAFMPRLRFNPGDNRGLYLADDNRRPVVMKNLWLGISAERQQEADERIPLLLQTPAAVRFVSAEPLLEKVDLHPWMLGWGGGEIAHCENCGHGNGFTRCPNTGGIAMTARRNGVECTQFRRKLGWGGLDWVIIGGESGPQARRMNPNWARSLRSQCAVASVQFFFKQFGEWAPFYYRDDGEPRQSFTFDDGTTVHRIGKKAAGRLLDGVEHSAFPLTP